MNLTGFDEDALAAEIGQASCVFSLEEGFEARGGLDALVQILPRQKPANLCRGHRSPPRLPVRTWYKSRIARTGRCRGKRSRQTITSTINDKG